MRRRRVVIGLVVLLVLAAGTVGAWYGTRPPRDQFGHLYDPIEDDPQVRPLLTEADREARRQLEELRSSEGRPGKPGLGDVHIYWRIKKHYLKDKYGIDWRTPAKMNPDVAFD